MAKIYPELYAPKPLGPNLSALPPLALYIHLPWCVKKCPYCDFNSHAVKAPDSSVVRIHAAAASTAAPEPATRLSPEIETRYIEALSKDLEAALPMVWGRPVVSVFFGGGTPSLFSAQAIERILQLVRALLPLRPDAEITLEANPGTFEQARFQGFRAAGINRLSLGVQSFNPVHLQALGRIHSAHDALSAIVAAKDIFGNVNVDLMYGLPGQTLDEARADVTKLLAHDLPHVSLYHLTLEPNTYFHRYPPILPDEDSSADIEAMIHEALAGAGYQHFETSAYAKAQRQCQHNRNYWEFGDYLGIGAGAHSKLSFPNRVIRQVRYKQPAQYMIEALAGRAIFEETDIGRNDMGFEFMLNALRLTEGVPSEYFSERTGYPLSLVSRGIAEGVAKGLLETDPARLCATALGQRFLNDLQSLFIAD